MPYQATINTVFIASPNDAETEREIARRVIHEWNDLNGRSSRIFLQPVGWETHSFPDMSDRAQGVINKQVLGDSDLLVAIFKHRIGTPTGAARGGTIEEIEEHLRMGKPAMIYFSSEAMPRNADLSQIQELNKARQEYQDRGYVSDFNGPEGFRHDFRRHLAQKMAGTVKDLELHHAPSVVGDRVETQMDILKFSNLQQVFLEIGLTVSSTAAPWKHEQRRKMMRVPRTLIEAEGFSWNFPELIEQTSFRQFVMHNARRPDEQNFNWCLEFLLALPEYTPAPSAHRYNLSNDCWIWDLAETRPE